jgi:ABC-type sugar transport system ATPase subunit
MADKIVVLNGGRIEQIGAPMELYRSPANKFVAGFLGSPRMNFLSAERVASAMRPSAAGGSAALLDAPFGGLREAATLGVRPEDLRLGAPAANEAMRDLPSTRQSPNRSALVLRGDVTLIERLGAEALAHVRVGGEESEPIVAKLAGDAPVSVGDAITLHASAGACHLFDREGRAVGTATTGART